MIRIIVSYGQPADPAAFDRHYRETHTPLTLAMPLLAGFEVSQGAISAAGNGEAPYLTAILSYASKSDMETSFASEAGKAAAADLANFATGGVVLLTCDMAGLI